MINRDYLGCKSEVREITVEQGQLKLFAKAIGETNPIYFDEAAAKRAGHKDIVAPPTFGSCLKLLAPQEKPTYEELGLDFKKLLHGEEKIEYFLPIHAGDKLTLVTEISDIYDKKGGALEFIVRVTDIRNEKEQLVQKITGIGVMRHGGGNG